MVRNPAWLTTEWTLVYRGRVVEVVPLAELVNAE
jgi:hypothetical protein